MEAADERLTPLGAREVRRALEGGASLLDLRDAGPYCEEHARGAVFIAYHPRSLPKHVAAVVPEGRPVILTGAEDRTAQVAAWARSSGGPEVLGRLEGGLEAWKAAGLPVEGVKRFSVEELRDRWNGDRKGWTLIDVREPFEWNLGTIEGAALVSLGRLLDRMNEFPPDGELVFLCEQGVRSVTAAGLFASRGYPNVAHVEGGFGAWFRGGNPIVE